MLIMLLKDGVVPAADWPQALSRFFEDLPDLIIDAPRAPKFVALFLIQAHRDGFFANWESVKHAVSESVPSQYWERIYGPIFQTIATELSPEEARSLLLTSHLLNPIHLFPFSQRTPARINGFLDTHALRSLFPLTSFVLDALPLLAELRSLDVGQTLVSLRELLPETLATHSDLPYFVLQVLLDSLYRYQKSRASEDQRSLAVDLWKVAGQIMAGLLGHPASAAQQYSLLYGAIDFVVAELPHRGLSIPRPFAQVVHYLLSHKILTVDAFTGWCEEFRSRCVSESDDSSNDLLPIRKVEDARKFFLTGFRNN